MLYLIRKEDISNIRYVKKTNRRTNKQKQKSNIKRLFTTSYLRYLLALTRATLLHWLDRFYAIIHYIIDTSRIRIVSILYSGDDTQDTKIYLYIYTNR